MLTDCCIHKAVRGYQPLWRPQDGMKFFTIFILESTNSTLVDAFFLFLIHSKQFHLLTFIPLIFKQSKMSADKAPAEKLPLALRKNGTSISGTTTVSEDCTDI